MPRVEPSNARSTDAATGQSSAASAEKIRKQIDLLKIPKTDWEPARRRMRFVKVELQRKGVGRAGYVAVARRPAVELRTPYRWIDGWGTEPTLTSFWNKPAGPRLGSRRLDGEREVSIDAVLDAWFGSRERRAVSRAVEEVTLRCRAARLRRVSRAAIESRLPARAGERRLRRIPRNPDHVPATRRALGIVQVDHNENGAGTSENETLRHGLRDQRRRRR